MFLPGPCITFRLLNSCAGVRRRVRLCARASGAVEHPTGAYVIVRTPRRRHLLGVFTLGRAIVGPRHAVLAVPCPRSASPPLPCPASISVPPIMAAPFWALALLLYWRAVGESRRGHRFCWAMILGCCCCRVMSGSIPDRLAGAVHASEPDRPPRAVASRAVDRRAALLRRGVPASRLAAGRAQGFRRLLVRRHHTQRRICRLGLALLQRCC